MENVAREEAQPIDVWFAEQDRAVDAELKVVRRNIRPRKIDGTEMEYRIAAQMAAEQEQLAVDIATARAVYRKFGLATVTEPERDFKDELVQALQRRAPGFTFEDYPRETRACETQNGARREDGTNVSKHYWLVRIDVIAKMRGEREEAARGTCSDAAHMPGLGQAHPNKKLERR
jgi:hypothetical protein